MDERFEHDYIQKRKVIAMLENIENQLNDNNLPQIIDNYIKSLEEINSYKIEIENNTFWEHDINKAIDDFEATYGIQPHIIIGRNFIELIKASYGWINEESINKSEGEPATYCGIPCEYDPNIPCVILKP